MSDIINVTFTATAVTVEVVTSPLLVNVPVTLASQALLVAVSNPSPQAVSLAVESVPQPVVIQITEGAPGPPGVAGANAQIQILTLAAYLALTPEQQTNGTWYLIPKT